ncbi:MAG: hypothetical protein GY820_10145 [Gammaproteobacteria bacterium]|nr:hypothetical protein [Gammaproteobacteria bacterium]
MVTEKKKKRYKLSAVLAKLVSEKRTGTLICVNEHNLQGRIFVEAGKVLMARCRSDEGKDALEIIQKHPLTLLKFHTGKNLVSIDEEEKKSTARTEGKEIKEVNSTTENGESEAVFESLLDAMSSGQLQDDDRFKEPITAGVREVLTEELAEQLGPLADILVSELPDGTILSEAINILSHGIDDLDLTMAFVESVKERV